MSWECAFRVDTYGGMSIGLIPKVGVRWDGLIH